MSELIAIAKPFLKWVGGKTQLLDEISKYYPEKIEKYCEPFVGGGAVLFDVLTKFQPKEVLINDKQIELGNLGVPAKAVGCSTLRYRSSSSLRCGGLLRRCSIA